MILLVICISCQLYLSAPIRQVMSENIKNTHKHFSLTCRCRRQNSVGGMSSPGQIPPLQWCTGHSCHTGSRRAAGSPLYRCTLQSGGRNPSVPSHSHTLNRQREKTWVVSLHSLETHSTLNKQREMCVQMDMYDFPQDVVCLDTNSSINLLV